MRFILLFAVLFCAPLNAAELHIKLQGGYSYDADKKTLTFQIRNLGSRVLLRGDFMLPGGTGACSSLPFTAHGRFGTTGKVSARVPNSWVLPLRNRHFATLAFMSMVPSDEAPRGPDTVRWQMLTDTGEEFLAMPLPTLVATLEVFPVSGTLTEGLTIGKPEFVSVSFEPMHIDKDSRVWSPNNKSNRSEPSVSEREKPAQTPKPPPEGAHGR